jgi:hypothetical protein
MKIPATVFVSLLIFAGTLALFANGQPGRSDSRDESKVRIGLAIAPVHLKFARRNRDLVGLGSYIVNAEAGCNDCHSCPSYALGGNPYMGQPKHFNAENYLAGGVPFGPFTSRNLTPEEGGLPAGRTFEQFELQLRTGIDLDNAHPRFGPLLQVMPWPVFQSMTDRDLLAVYEYLKAIPSATPGTCTGGGE